MADISFSREVEDQRQALRLSHAQLSSYDRGFSLLDRAVALERAQNAHEAGKLYIEVGFFFFFFFFSIFIWNRDTLIFLGVIALLAFIFILFFKAADALLRAAATETDEVYLFYYLFLFIYFFWHLAMLTIFFIEMSALGSRKSFCIV